MEPAASVRVEDKSMFPETSLPYCMAHIPGDCKHNMHHYDNQKTHSLNNNNNNNNVGSGKFSRKT
jgi:hypothetical protein